MVSSQRMRCRGSTHGGVARSAWSHGPARCRRHAPTTHERALCAWQRAPLACGTSDVACCLLAGVAACMHVCIHACTSAYMYALVCVRRRRGACERYSPAPR